MIICSGWNIEVPRKFASKLNSIQSRLDLILTAELIEECLRLDPNDRPTADELLEDPWFDGVE